MTLDEFMKTADKDTDYFVGSTSNFFFIGNPEEYQKVIDQMSIDFVEAVKKQKKASESRLNRLIKHGEPRCLADLEKYIERYYKEKSRLEKLVDIKKEYLKTFVPLRYREIKEVYEREIHNDGTVVIIEGSEWGKYWDKQEYVTGIIDFNGDDYEEDI